MLCSRAPELTTSGWHLHIAPTPQPLVTSTLFSVSVSPAFLEFTCICIPVALSFPCWWVGQSLGYVYPPSSPHTHTHTQIFDGKRIPISALYVLWTLHNQPMNVTSGLMEGSSLRICLLLGSCWVWVSFSVWIWLQATDQRIHVFIGSLVQQIFKGLLHARHCFRIWGNFSEQHWQSLL